MNDRSGVLAIVPAWNEADRIGKTVRALRTVPLIEKVLVVDDGSTDATAEIARQAGADVLVLSRNLGKSLAVAAAVDREQFPFYVLIDADLGETASWAESLIHPVLNGEADMSIAKFPVVPGRGGGSGWAMRTARIGTARLTGRVLDAPLSGQRCLTETAIRSAFPLSSGFGLEICLNVAVLRAGFRVVEVETTMDHRVTQNDWRGRRHRLRQWLHILRALVHAGIVYGSRK